MKNKNKIAILDFDDVLFHTKALGLARRDAFIKAGIAAEKYDCLYQQFREGLIKRGKTYRLKDHVALFIKQRPEIRRAFLKKELKLLKNRMTDFVFGDASSFLKHLGDDGWYRIILSFGNDSWQKEKIKYSGVEKLVDEIKITQDQSKASAVEALFKTQKFKPQKIIFVDDNPYKALNAVKNEFPQVTTVQLIRPEIEDRVRHPGCDHDCSSLEEIKKLL